LHCSEASLRTPSGRSQCLGRGEASKIVPARNQIATAVFIISGAFFGA
jgi:hypothetical protein